MTREGAYVMCRTCLNYSFPFSNIFKELLGEGYVYEVLMDVCQLEVSSDDGLPEYVCFDCHKNLSKLHSFKMQTHESNAALHRLKIKHEIESSDERKLTTKIFPYPTKKIEPASSFTSSAPNSGSSLKSTSRTMKECYVHLSRCDQLLQVGHSPKVNIKKEKEDPTYLGENEIGNIQGTDMQLPVALLGEGDSPSASKGANKEKLREEILQANTPGVVKLKEVLCSENLFSYGKEIEGDDIEIHEEKLYSEDAFLKFLSPRVYLTDKSVVGMGNLTSRDGHYPSDGVYIESEHQEIKETSEDGCDTVDSNLKHCEGNPEDIIPILFERSVQGVVELNLDQSYDEKSVDNGGLKIQEREHSEEMQFEIFEEKFETDYTCRKPRDIYQTCNVRHNSENSLNEFCSSECIDKRGLMRECDRETIKSDNVDSNTGENLFSCKYCSRKFRAKWYLSQHELEHSGVKPFSCSYCSKGFLQKIDLNRHVLIHTGVKPYICEYCSKKFRQKIHLKSHELTHTGVKPFSCSYCSKSFIQKVCLNTHVQIHTGIKPFSCKFCPKQFNVKSNLTMHELIHTGVKPYMCEYCSKRFRQKIHLKRHVLTHTVVKHASSAQNCSM